MNNPKIGKSRKGLTGTFSTLRITSDDSKRRGTGSPVPSDNSVEEAKDWVDYNKK